MSQPTLRFCKTLVCKVPTAAGNRYPADKCKRLPPGAFEFSQGPTFHETGELQILLDKLALIHSETELILSQPFSSLPFQFLLFQYL